MFHNDIDLSDIFIGREQQIDQFRFYLERWQRFSINASIPDLKAAPSPNEKIEGLVILLHGRGGFGKTTLLKRYCEIALEYSSEIQVSGLIDWEFAAQERRALFNPAQGEAIDASQYFSFMRDQLALALGRPRTDFKEYQVAVRAVDDARKQAQGVLKGSQQDDRYAWLRSLPGEIVLALIQSVPVVKNLPLLKDDAIAKAVSNAANAGVTIGVEQITQVWTLLYERLGDDLSDYLDAPWRLGKAIGYDLAQFARRRPILIFFDTYEEIDEGDKLLQMIMGAAGGRVGWVIAGRDNLWAGVGQRRRSLEVEYGYRDLVLPDRRMVIDFSADGVGDFTSSDIEEYFTQLSRKALRPALPAVSEKDAVHIRDVTGGVPLAVKIAAGLYLESQDLTLITESLDGKREIVDQMVERYLLHTRTNPADRARLYGLALLRRPEEPRALAAALDVPGNYDAELSRLHRRYGFIFTKQEQPALHQEVRYFLRLWLLQHRKSSPDITQIVQRLREAHLTSFQELEAQRNYTSLRERLEDEQWIGLYLDLTEQQFWYDPAEGVAYILPFMFAASVYHRDANREARTIGEFFQGKLVQPYRKQWDWANQSLVYRTSQNPLPEEIAGLKDLVRLASQTRISLPVPPLPEELEAALWWRLGEAYRGKSPNKAVYWYEKALSRLPHERDLREALTEALWDREHAIVVEEESDENSALQIIELTPPSKIPYRNDSTADETTTYISHGTLADLDRFIERDPKSSHAYTQRGEIYAARKKYRQAIADFDRALELTSQDGSIYAKRGEVYLLLKEYRRAIADFDRALELDPGSEAIKIKLSEASSVLTRPERTIGYTQQRLVHPLPISRRTILFGLVGLGLASAAGYITWQNLSSSRTLGTRRRLGSTIYTNRDHQAYVNAVTYSPDGKYIASASADRTIKVIDASTGKSVITCQGSTDVVNALAYSPEGKHIVSGSDDRMVRVWDASTGTLVVTSQGSTGLVKAVAYSPQRKNIASGGSDRIVRIWDASTGKLIINCRGHSNLVSTVSWSPNGRYLVSGSHDWTVKVWDATTWKNIFTYNGHILDVYAVAWSPNGKYIASGGRDKTIHVWDSVTKKPVVTYHGHIDKVKAVAWSPDGKWIASASDDQTVQVWDASTGIHIYTYRGHATYVYAVAWSPDGQHIVSGGADSTVQVWQAV